MRLRTANGRSDVSRPQVAVVGAGVAGLAAARVLARSFDVVVLERQPRIGGLVDTEHLAGGFVLEHGADCMLTTKPWGVAVARELGLGDAIVVGPEPRRAFVASGGRLSPLPTLFAGATPAGAVALARTPLIGWWAKARVALEPLVPRRLGQADESVAGFVERRFGRDVVPALIEPMLRGVYGDAAERLSAAACIPRLRAMERDAGSVVVGMRRARRLRRQAPPELPEMVTLRGGMGALPTAMARELGSRVRCGVSVERLTRTRRGFCLLTSGGSVHADAVVIATPAWAAIELLAPMAPGLAADLAAIRHVALDCVTMAWRRDAIPHPLDGTGFLSAATDPTPTRACTWSSLKWPGRSPAGWVLMRSVLAVPDATDDELVALARADLRELLGIRRPPALTRIRRIRRATPIYEVGHLERVARIQTQVRAIGKLGLAGNYFEGIGVPDSVRSGSEAARSAIAAIAGEGKCGLGYQPAV